MAMASQTDPSAGMKRALITWMVVAVSVGWIALMPWDAARRQHALPDYGTVPAFSFIDQERHSIRREDFEGSVWVADFIFTRCAGQCPLMSSRMAALQRSLSALGHDSVRFVSFSVDPSYDTPERLAA